MKRFLMFLLTIIIAASPCVLLVTCSKNVLDAPANDSYATVLKGNATIISTDTRMCPCCGGYFLSIDGQKASAGDYFIASEFPGGFRATSYPQRVYIEWKKDNGSCINDRVVISKILPIAADYQN